MTTPPIPGKVIYVRSANPITPKQFTPPAWRNAWRTGLVLAVVSFIVPFVSILLAYFDLEEAWQVAAKVFGVFSVLIFVPLAAIMAILGVIIMAKGAAGRGIIILFLAGLPLLAKVIYALMTTPRPVVPVSFG